MNRVEQLAERYGRLISAPWDSNLSGAEKAVFVVYDKADERKVRAKLQLFEIATTEADHKWTEFSCDELFPEWMGDNPYTEEYFEFPEDVEIKLDSEFCDFVGGKLLNHFERDDVDENTVTAVVGVSSLYGFVKLSAVLRIVEAHIRGRLVVFFPGNREENNYRMLDIRDGWNYLAVPVTLHDGGIYSS